MGLAIVKKLVERQNCRIAVHSQGGGSGAQFRFRWPVLPLAVDPKEAASA
jgi:signal transduction histidine kinase